MPCSPRGRAVQSPVSFSRWIVRRKAEAPDLPGTGGGGEAHLGERDTVLRHPALRGHRGSHFPHAFVIAVRVGVVVEGEVRLHARRVGLEHVAGLVVVARIEPDADAVARRRLVAAAETADDPVRRPIVAANHHVDEAIVIGELEPRPFGHRIAVVGIPLDEAFNRLRLAPGLVVGQPVDARRRADEAICVENLVAFVFRRRFGGVDGRLRNVLRESRRRHHGASGGRQRGLRAPSPSPSMLRD